MNKYINDFKSPAEKALTKSLVQFIYQFNIVKDDSILFIVYAIK